MERNAELEKVAAVFVGDWTVTIENMWWEPETVTTGSARGYWLGDSFVRFEAELDGKPTWDFVFGRSDANDAFVALYNDERCVMRIFDLTMGDGSWLMQRLDPDFHQNFQARIDGDRMVCTTNASDDAGVTWRKDFDLTFTRR